MKPPKKCAYWGCEKPIPDNRKFCSMACCGATHRTKTVPPPKIINGVEIFSMSAYSKNNSTI